MSTIPTTSSPSYTAVGGAERAASTGLSAILLNRGSRYPRRTLFTELEKVGFDYIISMESSGERYDLEDLCARFPFVRFILLKDKVSVGEEINLAASELQSPLFFTLWNDQKIFNGGGAPRYAELFGKSGRLCTAPVIQNAAFEVLPSLVSPLYEKGSLRTLPLVPEKENQSSLYPWDWVGLFNREAFTGIGGFDPAITSPYWQLLDFGMRARLWGEEIRVTRNIHVVYDGNAEPEDGTADSSYRLFYLKNIAPVFRGDGAHLPLRRFPAYLAKSGWDLLTAWNEFGRARKWVAANAGNFTADARTVIDLWGEGE